MIDYGLIGRLAVVVVVAVGVGAWLFRRFCPVCGICGRRHLPT